MLKENFYKTIVESRRKGDSLSVVVNNYLKKNPSIVFPFQIIGLQEGDYMDFTTEEWQKLSVEMQQKNASAYQEWYANQKKEALEKEVPLLSNKKSTLLMRLIPPGKFWMGTSKFKNGHPSEERHKVLISEIFCCGKYPVTQEQWKAVFRRNPSKFKENERNPVEKVNWVECQEFCKKTGTQLLSEAQWEYACRAGTTTTYNFGEEPNHLDKYAWYHENSERKTHPVGEKKANAWGLYDMHGNVWEWCSDWYGKYTKSEQKDPTGASFGTYRVHRGGSWNDFANVLYSAYHTRRVEPELRIINIGFRVSRLGS